MTPATRRAGSSRTLKPVIAPFDERITRLTTVALPGMSRPVMRVTTARLVGARVRWAVCRLGSRADTFASVIGLSLSSQDCHDTSLAWRRP